MSRFLLFIAVIFCFPSLSMAKSREGTLVIVSPKSHYDMVHRIETALFSEPSFKLAVRHLEIERLNNDSFRDSSIVLVMTLGEQALTQTLAQVKGLPILATLIRKADFQTVLYENCDKLNSESPNITAFFLDQPVDRMINLVRCLSNKKEKTHSIGVLLGPDSTLLQPSLMEAARERGLSLNIAHLNIHENPIQPLKHLMEESNILLALPDPHIYNAKTAKAILLTTFRRRIPVIAFSKTYVKIGALAAVYATPEQLGVEIADFVLEILENPKGALPGPRLPKQFQVTMNTHVARTLSLPLYSESQLKYALEDMEEHHKMSCMIKEEME